MGLSSVSAAGAVAQSAVKKAAAGAARGGRNAELQSKGRHSDNAFRLDPGHCHHLSNPDVLIAYNKWATNQSTGKKALYWAFYDELKVPVGKYPPIWRCVGCHPVASAALTLYEQKKELKAMPTGVSTGSPLRGGQRLNTAAEDARRRAFAKFERWQRRAVSNIDSLKLFATLKEAYPLICMIQKCLLAFPPSQSDCEELFSLLGLYQGIFMYVCR